MNQKGQATPEGNAHVPKECGTTWTAGKILSAPPVGATAVRSNTRSVDLLPPEFRGFQGNYAGNPNGSEVGDWWFFSFHTNYGAIDEAHGDALIELARVKGIERQRDGQSQGKNDRIRVRDCHDNVLCIAIYSPTQGTNLVTILNA